RPRLVRDLVEPRGLPVDAGRDPRTEVCVRPLVRKRLPQGHGLGSGDKQRPATGKLARAGASRAPAPWLRTQASPVLPRLDPYPANEVKPSLRRTMVSCR